MDHADDYLDSLSLPGLNMEIYAEQPLQTQATALLRYIQPLWSHFAAIARQEKIFETLGISPERQVLELDLHWVGDETMQALNREYRNKDSATDVLTFTLFADHADPGPWRALPVVQLGSIFIDIEWAEAELKKNPALHLERYLMERLVHGFLHLLGVHHDTMEAYNRVVRIQQSVLDSVFIQTDSRPATEPAT
jgi:probable rRNA maturation factor